MRRPLPFVIISTVAAASAVFVALLITTQPRTSASPVALMLPVSATFEPKPTVSMMVTSSQVIDTLVRLRLDAQSLAAAAVSAADVPDVVDGLHGELGEVIVTLQLADSNYAQARNIVDQLERKVQAGLAAGNDLESLATWRSTLATATTARSTLLNDLFSTAIAAVPVEQRDRLTASRANERWEVPAEYLVVTRTEAEWVNLRDALSHERYALSHDQEVAPAVQQFLAEVRANDAVVDAMANMQANGNAIAEAWEQATQ